LNKIDNDLSNIRRSKVSLIEQYLGCFIFAVFLLFYFWSD